MVVACCLIHCMQCTMTAETGVRGDTRRMTVCTRAEQQQADGRASELHSQYRRSQAADECERRLFLLTACTESAAAGAGNKTQQTHTHSPNLNEPSTKNTYTRNIRRNHHHDAKDWKREGKIRRNDRLLLTCFLPPAACCCLFNAPDLIACNLVDLHARLSHMHARCVTLSGRPRSCQQ